MEITKDNYEQMEPVIIQDIEEVTFLFIISLTLSV
jgi:hypothetical protein